MDCVIKKILVTGASGYAGMVLVPNLIEKGYVVRAVGFSNKHGSWSDLALNENLELINADLRDEKKIEQLIDGVDMIVHLAAVVGEQICKDDPTLAYDINVNLVKIINKIRKDIPLIFISTTSVYGDDTSSACDERTLPNPKLAYAKSKYDGEKLVVESDNFIILRPATLFGYSPAINYNMLVNNFVWHAVNNKKLEVYDDNLNRTFVHVSDLSKSIIFMIENFGKFKNEIFNVGDNDLNFTKRQVVEMLKSLINFELISSEGNSQNDKRNFIVKYNKLNEAGFYTQKNLMEGIKELLVKLI